MLWLILLVLEQRGKQRFSWTPVEIWVFEDEKTARPACLGKSGVRVQKISAQTRLSAACV